MKKMFVLSLIVMIVLAACKKDPKEQASLLNKWTIDNSVGKEYINGVLINTTTVPGGGATMDFQSNGNVLIASPGSPIESFPYTLKLDSKVEFDGDIYEIRNLAASTVTLFLREDLGGGDYDEVFINLKK